jgi:hypothetical protein
LSLYGSGSTSIQPSSATSAYRTYAPPPKLTMLRTLMSSRSSLSLTCSRSSTSRNGSRSERRPASMRIEASVTSRAKRSGRIAAGRAAPMAPPRPRRPPAVRAAGAASTTPSAWRSHTSSARSRTKAASDGGSRTRACSRSPSTHAASSRSEAYDVSKTTAPSSAASTLPEAALVALDLPGDPRGDPHARVPTASPYCQIARSA